MMIRDESVMKRGSRSENIWNRIDDVHDKYVSKT